MDREVGGLENWTVFMVFKCVSPLRSFGSNLIKLSKEMEFWT